MGLKSTKNVVPIGVNFTLVVRSVQYLFSEITPFFFLSKLTTKIATNLTK